MSDFILNGRHLESKRNWSDCSGQRSRWPRESGKRKTGASGVAGRIFPLNPHRFLIPDQNEPQRLSLQPEISSWALNWSREKIGHMETDFSFHPDSMLSGWFSYGSINYKNGEIGCSILLEPEEEAVKAAHFTDVYIFPWIYCFCHTFFCSAQRLMFLSGMNLPIEVNV